MSSQTVRAPASPSCPEPLCPPNPAPASPCRTPILPTLPAGPSPPPPQGPFIAGVNNTLPLISFTGMAYTNDVTGEALPFGPTLRVDRKSNFSITVTNRVVAGTNHFPVNSTAYNYWKNPGNTNMHTHGMHSATGGLTHKQTAPCLCTTLQLLPWLLTLRR